MTGHGGWPLNVFLTPDGVPFFGGTYFPPEPRHGMPAGRRCSRRSPTAWREQREEIAERRRAVVRRASSGAAPLEPPERRLDRAALDAAVERLLAPGVTTARTAASAARRSSRRLGDRVPAAGPPRAAARASARWSHDAARDGGGRHLRPARRRLRALLGRRALARPALREDALRQRAARARLPARLAGLRRASCCRRVCERDARLGAARDARPEGGFASALDADSEGVEGKFYVWTLDELRAVLGEPRRRRDRALRRDRAPATSRARNIPVRAAPEPDPRRLERSRARLLGARAARVRARPRRQAPDAPGTR